MCIVKKQNATKGAHAKDIPCTTKPIMLISKFVSDYQWLLTLKPPNNIHDTQTYFVKKHCDHLVLLSK